MGGPLAHLRDWMVGGVRHPVPDAAFPAGAQPDVGRQFPAQHPAPQRAQLTGRRFRGSTTCIASRSRARSTALETPALRNLKLTPFVLGEVLESGVRPVDTEFDPDAGVDLKYSVTPSLVLDATVNTDFAQVEIDDQQVNLDRFDLFFPEKRPFFLENAGFFTVGNPGEIDLFFSRRIGIGPSGERIAINGGGRLSGKAGKYNIGLLNMQTDDVELLKCAGPAGAIAREQLHRRARQPRPPEPIVDRRALHQPDRHRPIRRDDDYNRTYAIDGKAGIRQHTVLSSFVSKTDTPGVTRTTPRSTSARGRACRDSISNSDTRRSAAASIPRSGS